jgi:hypothetical protein
MPSSRTAIFASAAAVSVFTWSCRSAGNRSPPLSKTFVFVPMPCDAPGDFPYGGYVQKPSQ